VLDMGIECRAVHGPADTEVVIGQLLDSGLSDHAVGGGERV
jgi:hypothetical protein